MLSGSLAKKMVFFALPLAASSILQQLFNAADLAVVGKFASSQAMAAVGSNGAVINLIISLFVGLSVGANVVIGGLIGAGQTERIQKAVHTIVTVAFLSGAFLTILGYFVSRPILILMGAPQEVLRLAILYLRIYFLAMPAIMTYNFGSSILRSKGDSTRPLYALALSGVLNVLLNLLFVAVFHLHVIGVALATVLSNMVAAGLTLYFLLTEEETFRLNLKRLGIEKEYLVKMTRIGLPAGLQGAVFSLSNVVIQSAVNSFGATAIAGATSAQYFDFVSFCCINAFSQAALTFTSQNYAAGKIDRCKRIFRISMGISLAASVTVVSLFVALRYQLISLFTSDPAVVEYGIMRTMSAFAFHYLIASYEVTGGCLRGMNYSLLPALIATFGTVVVRILYVTFYFPRHRSFTTLFHVYPLSWVITGVIMLTGYFLVRRHLWGKQKAE